eukprot:scaffold230258_cov17-Tisochrysis_lutea.AAC.1
MRVEHPRDLALGSDSFHTAAAAAGSAAAAAAHLGAPALHRGSSNLPLRPQTCTHPPLLQAQAPPPPTPRAAA